MVLVVKSLFLDYLNRSVIAERSLVAHSLSPFGPSSVYFLGSTERATSDRQPYQLTNGCRVSPKGDTHSSSLPPPLLSYG
jgi:hypothetical protein